MGMGFDLCHVFVKILFMNMLFKKRVFQFRRGSLLPVILI
jgi:hypothetical protein